MCIYHRYPRIQGTNQHPLTQPKQKVQPGLAQVEVAFSHAGQALQGPEFGGTQGLDPTVRYDTVQHGPAQHGTVRCAAVHISGRDVPHITSHLHTSYTNIHTYTRTYVHTYIHTYILLADKIKRRRHDVDCKQHPLLFFSLSPFFSFLFLALPWRLVPRIPSIAYPSARFLLAGALVHHLGRHMQTQLQCKAQPRFLPSFCWVFLIRPGEPRRPVRMGWGGGGTAFSLRPPLSPGARSRVWNVEVKTKVPDRNLKQAGGGNNIPEPHPQATRQSQSWIGPVSTACGRRRPTHHSHLHTPCASARLFCTSQVPRGSERGVLV